MKKLLLLLSLLAACASAFAADKAADSAAATPIRISARLADGANSHRDFSVATLAGLPVMVSINGGGDSLTMTVTPTPLEDGKIRVAFAVLETHLLPVDSGDRKVVLPQIGSVYIQQTIVVNSGEWSTIKFSQEAQRPGNASGSSEISKSIRDQYTLTLSATKD